MYSAKMNDYLQSTIAHTSLSKFTRTTKITYKHFKTKTDKHQNQTQTKNHQTKTDKCA